MPDNAPSAGTKGHVMGYEPLPDSFESLWRDVPAAGKKAVGTEDGIPKPAGAPIRMLGVPI
jgi:hypothetical protein